MHIDQLLLVLDANAPADAACNLAASLATGGGVEGICLFHEPEPTVAEDFAYGRQGVADVLDHLKEGIARLTTAAEASFRKAIGDQGLSDGWRLAEVDDWRNAALASATLSDLVVTTAAGADHAFQAAVAGLVLQSAAPCLIAPSEGVARAPFRQVAIAWNGSREAARAVRDARAFLKAADRVVVLVATEEATKWIDAAHGDALTRALARHGVRAEVVRVTGESKSIGEQLLAECRSLGVDLLVSGAYSHSRAAETLLGGVTRTLLTRAQLPVLLSH